MIPESQTFLIAMEADVDLTTEQVATTITQAMMDEHKAITSAVVETMGTNSDEVNEEITEGLFSNRRLSMYIGDTFRNDPQTDPDYYPREVNQFVIGTTTAADGHIIRGYDVREDISPRIVDQISELCREHTEGVCGRLGLAIPDADSITSVTSDGRSVQVEHEYPSGENGVNHEWNSHECDKDSGKQVLDSLLSVVSGLKDELGIKEMPKQIDEVTITAHNVFLRENFTKTHKE